MGAAHVRGAYAAVDVHYPGTGAHAAVVLAADDTFAEIVDERVVRVRDVAPYQPGNFASRELPPILAVLSGTADLRLLVVDGYVHLDPHGRPGLGAHAHAALGIPVVGVAKTAFHGADHALPVHRGAAQRPLYVTAAGMPPEDAGELVGRMSGPRRIPDAMRRVDALARGRAVPPAG